MRVHRRSPGRSPDQAGRKGGAEGSPGTWPAISEPQTCPPGPRSAEGSFPERTTRSSSGWSAS